MASYDLIATGNFTSSASQYSLTGIPGGYTDLVIVISRFRADANSQLQYTFNNTTSDYSVALWTMNMNFSQTSFSNILSGGFYTGASYGVGASSNQVIRIQVGQYAQSGNFKTWFGQGQAQNSVGSSFESTIFGGMVSTGQITSFQINSGATLNTALVHVYGIQAS